MSEEKLTAGDISRSIDRLEELLGKYQVPDLQRLVREVRAKAVEAGVGIEVMPIGIIGEVDQFNPQRAVLNGVRPDVPCRVSHLVLDPDSARDFDLVLLQLANVQVSGPTVAVPLDTFSVEYVKNGELSKLHRWRTVEITPSNRITMVVRLTAKKLAEIGRSDQVVTVPFRGVLWTEYVWPPY